MIAPASDPTCSTGDATSKSTLRGFAAHYVPELEKIDNTVVPVKRMIYVRDDVGEPIPDQLVVSIELTDIRAD